MTERLNWLIRVAPNGIWLAPFEKRRLGPRHVQRKPCERTGRGCITYQPWREAPEDPDPASTLILDVEPPELEENKFCFLCCPVCGICHGVLCLVTKLCLTLCDPMDCSPPGSSVLGIFQARILEWVAISSSRGSPWAKNQTHVSFISCIGRWILHHCTTWDAHLLWQPQYSPWGLASAQLASLPLTLARWLLSLCLDPSSDVNLLPHKAAKILAHLGLFHLRRQKTLPRVS